MRSKCESTTLLAIMSFKLNQPLPKWLLPTFLISFVVLIILDFLFGTLGGISFLLIPILIFLTPLVGILIWMRRSSTRRATDAAERQMVVTGAAIIPCPTCKREISAIAFACPHCGHPLRIHSQVDQTRKTNLWLRLILIAIGIPVIVLSLKSCAAGN